MTPAIRKGEPGLSIGRPFCMPMHNPDRYGAASAAWRSEERYAPVDWFDVWSPDLAMARCKASAETWKGFVRAFKAEIDVPTAQRTLNLPAALSRGTNRSAAPAKTRPAVTGLCFANC